MTGEGRVDTQSQEGKVVGHVIELARSVGRPAQVIAGVVDPEMRSWLAARGARALEASPQGLRPEALSARAQELVEAAAFEARLKKRKAAVLKKPQP